MRCSKSLSLLFTLVSLQGGALGATSPSRAEPKAPPPAAAASTSLKVGDPAPSLGKLRTLQGEPVHELERGKLYLLEFWATWCTSCKMLVPHLSQVARDYRGKVTVLSVNVMEQGHEDEPYSVHLPKLKRFMKNGGKGMDYTVAMDDDARTVEKGWLDITVHGFPSAVLVDRMGTVAWIGYPGETLPTLLDLAFENKLDAAAIQRLKAQEGDHQKETREFTDRIVALTKAKRYQEALERVEGRLNQRGMQGRADSNLLLAKYMLLTFLNPAEARKIGEAYLAQNEDYPVYLTMFAMGLTSGISMSGEKYAYQDCELALQAARLAYEKGDNRSPIVLRDLARAYALTKDYQNAMTYQKLAIDSLKDYGADSSRAGMMKILKEFQTKSKAARKPQARK